MTHLVGEDVKPSTDGSIKYFVQNRIWHVDLNTLCDLSRSRSEAKLALMAARWERPLAIIAHVRQDPEDEISTSYFLEEVVHEFLNIQS